MKTKQQVVSFQKTRDTLFLIFRILGLDDKIDPYSCRMVAKKLNRYNPRKERPWTYSYIRNIYKGKQSPSRYITPAIEKLHNYLMKPPKPTRKRYRKIIEATSKEQLEKWNTLSADELRDALDEKSEDVKCLKIL